MKVINIDKRLKLALTLILLATSVIVSLQIFNALKDPKAIEKKIPVYKYNQNSDVDYKVLLKPNPLYKEKTLEKDQIYITEFIKTIKSSFIYNFSGNQIADIEGNYEVVGVMEGFSGEGEKQMNIWKKEFPLIALTPIKVKDKSISIKEDVSLDFEKYNSIANQIIQESKVGSQVRFSALMKLNLKATTDKGIVEVIDSPTMTIPLSTNYIEIVTKETKDKQGVIEENQSVQIPPSKRVMASYIIVLIVSMATLYWLRKYTLGIEKDIIAKTLDAMFKKYGDRLVALTSPLPEDLETVYAVRSIEDLIKIADEIAKPILYRYTHDFKDITKFYVFDSHTVYTLDLKMVLNELIVASSHENINLKKTWFRSM